MSAVVIRQATAADAKALAALIGELLALHDTSAPERLDRALVRDGFGPAPRFEALIAEADGVALGMALFYPGYRPSLMAPGLVLEDLHVRAEARGKGIGRRLLARLATIAGARGCAYVEWTVAADNDGARAFYHRLGAGERKGKTAYCLDATALAVLAVQDGPLAGTQGGTG